MYEVAWLKEKRGRDLNQVKCIKYDNEQVLSGCSEMIERWRCYFDQPFNVIHEDDFIDLNVPLTEKKTLVESGLLTLKRP